jgi:branched-subunit amino acid aminotransferase/4-amino-4-deoxychorismate lyase
MSLYLNGRWHDHDSAAGWAAAFGFHFGLGAFTTLAVRSGRPVFLRQHLHRLCLDAELLGLRPPTSGKLRALVDAGIARSGYRDGVVRIMLAGSSPGSAPRSRAPRLAMLFAGHRRAPRAADLLLCPFRPTAWRARKLTAYMDSALLAGHARAHSCFDALAVDGEDLLDTSIANLFLVSPEGLSTPAADGRLLPGIARGILLAAYGDAARETQLTVRSFRQATAVFLTNSVRGVIPVGRVLDEMGRLVWRGDSAAPAVRNARRVLDFAMARDAGGGREGFRP